MGLIVGFSLKQFSEILKIRDATGKPYLLIGGQAVNYWAERYLASEAQLKALRPFTSDDIDFKGNADDVRRISEQLALKPGYPPKVAMTALAIEAKWEDKIIRVLDSVSLLASKLELVATVPQAKRNDIPPHLKTLVPCVRAFLEELLQQVERKEIPARSWLLTANQALKLTTDRRAEKIGAKHGINWLEILPLAAIGKSQDEKIRRFREQQLEQGHKNSKSISI